MPKPHVVAVHIGQKVEYHFVQSKAEEDRLIGDIVGRFETDDFLANESIIQTLVQESIKQ